MNANTIEYVATVMRHLDSDENKLHPYGEACRVYVNGEWRFDINAVDRWDGMCFTTMLMDRDPDGSSNTAGFHLLPSLIEENITALSSVFPPF